MNQRTGLLTGLLIVQLIIVGLLLLRGGGGGNDEGKWLDFDAAGLERIEVSGEDAGVTLSKVEDDWRVGDYPADGEKVSELIEAFADLSKPWPVATTGDSAKRFEVTEEAHQRAILFAGNEGETQVYLGTSPGYQRVHAREATSNDIYAVRFSNFKAPTATDDWLDKALLAAVGDVQSVRRGEALSLTRREGAWHLPEAAAEATSLDQGKAQRFVDRFATLRVTGVAGEKGEQAVPAGALTVVDADGELKLTLLQAEEEYFIRSSRQSGTFAIAAYVAEQLLADNASLEAETEEEAADASEATPAPAA